MDIAGDAALQPRYATRAWLTWDNEHLYVAAEMEEPNVRARQTKRDSIVYLENDFEVFIDPEGDGLDYFEIEINAAGTVLDLVLDKPYRKKGSANLAWDAAELRSAVFVDGTLNDPSDKDRGWTVEMAIPWGCLIPPNDLPAPAKSPVRPPSVVQEDARRAGFWRPGAPPQAGDVWRINFARVQWPEHIELGSWQLSMKEASHWAWSPQGEVNMHIPERWGYTTFSR